ncbi:hypothetical protein HYS79_01640 [Patescibacteria group bacterium]|nr:hypothetical protein [Patescibacteria group bacterium]
MKDWRKYILALIITAAMFVTAFYLTSMLNSARLADIRGAQEQIAIDLLSSETQFELLGNLDCNLITQNPILSEELNSMAERLSFAENNLNPENDNVVRLKKQYTLLEIKDYLLMEQISKKCNTSPVSILYFYSNQDDCPDCTRAGDVLTYLRQTYPSLRVYSFDYHLDLGALQTLISLRKVKADLPALIINNRIPVYGFRNLEETRALIPELKDLATSTTETK